MKKHAKVIILILIVSMFTVLVGCGKDEEKTTEKEAEVVTPDEDKEAEADAPDEEEPEPAAVDEAILGQYDATSYVYDGTELDTMGEWIKLESADRGTFFIANNEYPFSYTLEGEKFTMNQDVGVSYEGTLVDGVITLDMPSTVYTFEKK
ncbi:MAG TPA: hypothetical protein GXX72_02295 [Clostridiaceae bacterium]|nr:hypothetical protein [Clostridiaceae bacterium]